MAMSTNTPTSHVLHTDMYAPRWGDASCLPVGLDGRCQNLDAGGLGIGVHQTVSADEKLSQRRAQLLASRLAAVHQVAHVHPVLLAQLHEFLPVRVGRLAVVLQETLHGTGLRHWGLRRTRAVVVNNACQHRAQLRCSRRLGAGLQPLLGRACRTRLAGLRGGCREASSGILLLDLGELLLVACYAGQSVELKLAECLTTVHD